MGSLATGNGKLAMHRKNGIRDGRCSLRKLLITLGNTSIASVPRPSGYLAFTGKLLRDVMPNCSSVFSSSHVYAARPTETPGRPISANDRVGKPISAHPPRSLLSAARNPSDTPNSLAFEFYLMGVIYRTYHEHSQVGKTLPQACAIAVATNLPRTSGSIIRSGWRGCRNHGRLDRNGKFPL